jgi:NAD(P)-dependent dehydrogenase (short-subunit alcohol dehydrogenase family)
MRDRKKIVIFGATGTIGKAVVAALSPKHEVFEVGNRQGQFKTDLADVDSIRNVFKGSAVISLVNAGLEGFACAAALEAPRGIRINVVSPPCVTETLKALNMDPSPGKPAAV